MRTFKKQSVCHQAELYKRFVPQDGRRMINPENPTKCSQSLSTNVTEVGARHVGPWNKLFYLGDF